MSGAALLEADNITVRFGGLVAVDGVSARFAAGALVGIIGPNGAGKTTLLKLVTGELAPSAGAVVRGVNTTFAYFDQGRTTLTDDWTVLDNVSGIEGSDRTGAGQVTIGARVLDSAAGLGQDSRALARGGVHAVCAEPSHRMLELARLVAAKEPAPPEPGRVIWARAWSEALPFRADVDHLEDFVVDKVLKTVRQDVRGNPKASLEICEAANTEERVADDEQRPPVPEHFEGLADSAVHVGEARATHGRSIAENSVASSNQTR